MLLTAGEVAGILNIEKTKLIRLDIEAPSLAPLRNLYRIRLYTVAEVFSIMRVFFLVKTYGYTIQEAYKVKISEAGIVTKESEKFYTLYKVRQELVRQYLEVKKLQKVTKRILQGKAGVYIKNGGLTYWGT